MKKHSEGLHHYHKRKRGVLKSKAEPHRFRHFMDRAIYVVGIIGPIMTIPQIMKIWAEKNATGVSVVSWVAYLVAAVFWLIYGIMHKEKPIILTYSAWIVLEIFVIIGTLMYG